MKYSYRILSDVLDQIAKDTSTENIFDQIERLTTDECRVLIQIARTAEDGAIAKIFDQGETI